MRSTARGGGFATELAANGRYLWQLKAQNGRLVAVSSAVYGTADDAAHAFRALVTEGPGLVARIRHVRDGLGWTWVVPGRRGEAVVRSSRAYERHATCQNSFKRFVALLEKLSNGSEFRSAGGLEDGSGEQR